MKRYHGMCKYQQINCFPNVVKDIRPTYGNKEELAPLNDDVAVSNCHQASVTDGICGQAQVTIVAFCREHPFYNSGLELKVFGTHTLWLQCTEYSRVNL